MDLDGKAVQDYPINTCVCQGSFLSPKLSGNIFNIAISTDNTPFIIQMMSRLFNLDLTYETLQGNIAPFCS